MRRVALGPELGVALLLAGCGSSLPPLPASTPLPEPDPDEVERVVFLIGDTGNGIPAQLPVFSALGRDIEHWAARLDTGAVTLLVLGDLIYPDGMHPHDDPEFSRDSIILGQQIELVTGPAAMAREARAYFLAGNHDYMQETDEEGRLRLSYTQTFIERARLRDGAQAWLLPGLHEPGPTVVDMGERLRLVLLDTAWWLLVGEQQEKNRMLIRLDAALATAGDRDVIVAAHHPYTSAGPHGGYVSLWKMLGIRYVLARSGAILQDLNSEQYRELRLAIEQIFERRGRPLLFAGGHEHSLQVIRHYAPGAPRWTAVSGSGSKISAVGRTEGMLFGSGQMGYMSVHFRRDGHVDLFATAVPEAYNVCPPEPTTLRECTAAGLAAAEVVYSVRLK